MNQGPKPSTKCHRTICRKPLSAHVEGGDGCKEFLRRKLYKRVSGSFNVDAIEVGAAVLLGVLQGKDVRLMVARPAFGVFAKTVASLAARSRTLPEAPSRHPTQDKVLAKLREVGPCSSKQLAAAAGMQINVTTSTLTLLKHRGLVTLNLKVKRPASPIWTAKPSNVVTQLSERKVAVR
jgi:hypothetical protein